MCRPRWHCVELENCSFERECVFGPLISADTTKDRMSEGFLNSIDRQMISLYLTTNIFSPHNTTVCFSIQHCRKKTLEKTWQYRNQPGRTWYYLFKQATMKNVHLITSDFALWSQSWSLRTHRSQRNKQLTTFGGRWSFSSNQSRPHFCLISLSNFQQQLGDHFDKIRKLSV